MAAPPRATADLALLLKTVTTLEQQRPGASSQVLSGLSCRHVVLSLPRGSLSGRRSYADDPAQIAADAVRGTDYRIEDEASFGSEIAYHLTAG